MASTAASRKELISKARRIVPPMLESFHKGQLGRVAVIGGSEDYTGAPYFSAMASAKLGCDMSHIICDPGAGAVIKTYSPNLMVHPYMRSSASTSSSLSDISSPILSMLSRLHVLVIGPGLGRNSLMHSICGEVLKAAREKGIPVVLDADGLMLAQKRPELVQGWRGVVLTPNVVEFKRLAESKGLGLDPGEEQASDDGAEGCAKLADAFGGVTIVRKGASDHISNGTNTLVSDGQGSLKRSGGQGDTLTGCIATLLAWRKAYHDELWTDDGNGGKRMDEAETLALAAWAGSAITRESARLAFEEQGRSMQASDLTGLVHRAFLSVLGEKRVDGKL